MITKGHKVHQGAEPAFGAAGNSLPGATPGPTGKERFALIAPQRLGTFVNFVIFVRTKTSLAARAEREEDRQTLAPNSAPR